MEWQGVRSIEDFYRTYLSPPRAPKTLREWRLQSEAGLATATNGAVFWDLKGAFTQVRDALLAYYPENLRRKKIARRCALAAQSGQYNYPRCVQRGQTVAAFQALAEFVKEAQALVFLLNRRYQPYYKWTHTALAELPILGGELAPLFQELVGGMDGVETASLVERVCEMLISELKRQGLSDHPGTFLIDHGRCVQETIRDPDLRALHLMAE